MIGGLAIGRPVTQGTSASGAAADLFWDEIFSMSTILRAWTFWILTPLREECREHLENTKLKEYRAVPGCQRAVAMFRDLGDGSTEVAFVSVWSSMAHIRAHVGEDILMSTIAAEDRKKLLDREPTVRHYEVKDPNALGGMPPEWRALLGPSRDERR